MGVLLLSVYLAFDCFRIRRSSGFRFFSRVGRACWVLQGVSVRVCPSVRLRDLRIPPPHIQASDRAGHPREQKEQKVNFYYIDCPEYAQSLHPERREASPELAPTQS